MPEGRAANHASAVVTLRPPIAAPLPGASVSLAVIGSPARVSAVTCSGDSFFRMAFCVERRVVEGALPALRELGEKYLSRA